MFRKPMEEQYTTMTDSTLINLAKWHWHIEVSSKCTLRCPRCAREEVPGTLVNTELSIGFIKRNFTPEFITAHVEKITFCGDDGDPIYARDFIDIIKYFKSVRDIEIVIVTNGSYKSVGWWEKLGAVLTSIDTIHFSVDGWDQNSNEMYRINSNFESIMLGMQTIRRTSEVFMVWDTILFSFNEDHVAKITSLAKDCGCDLLQLTKSTKFHAIYPSYPELDILQPKQQHISSIGRFERTLVQLTRKTQSSKSKNTNIKLANATIQDRSNTSITPLCLIGNKGMYISSLGKLYPCCWVANRYNHNNEWQQLGADLNVVLLSNAIDDPSWTAIVGQFRWLECKTKCSSKIVTVKYGTEW